MVKSENQLILFRYLALFSQNPLYKFSGVNLCFTSQIIVDIFVPLGENRKKKTLSKRQLFVDFFTRRGRDVENGQLLLQIEVMVQNITCHITRHGF